MKRGRIALVGAMILTLAVVLAAVGARDVRNAEADEASVPVMSVAMTRAESSSLPIRVPVTGHIAAWQEAIIGAEGDGLRLIEVRVNVGDVVKRGQALAAFNADIVEAELAEARAAVAQAEAESGEAETNARRAKALDASGAMSAQQVDQYVAAATTARARLDAARAVEQRHRVRVAHTRVLAPSDGIITSRTATVGAVVPAGQELFRLIRDGRLEWRAAVSAADLDKLVPGQVAAVDVRGHGSIRGTVRMVGPEIDVATHSGLAFIDLPREDALRAGAFVTGHVEIGQAAALTVPQSAVLLRDGFHYVMLVGPASEVIVRKVSVRRRAGDRIEITQGLSASEDVIASGLGFLSDGDLVRVVDEPADQAMQAPTASGGERAADVHAGGGA